jgi:hypothetical protein
MPITKAYWTGNIDNDTAVIPLKNTLDEHHARYIKPMIWIYVMSCLPLPNKAVMPSEVRTSMKRYLRRKAVSLTIDIRTSENVKESSSRTKNKYRQWIRRAEHDMAAHEVANIISDI